MKPHLPLQLLICSFMFMAQVWAGASSKGKEMLRMTPPDNIEICEGLQVADIQFQASDPATTFSWVNNNPGIGLAISGQGNIPAFIAQLSGTQVQVANIIVTPFLHGVAGQPESFTITVKPIPQMPVPTSQTVCSGQFIQPVAFISSLANTEFYWTNNQPGIGLMPQGTGDIAAFTPANFGSSLLVATITVTPELNGCAGSPVSFSLNVHPLANLIQPFNQFVCHESETSSIHFTGTSSATQFVWTNDNPAIGLPASGTGDISAFRALNAGNQRVSANITVTATLNQCPGASRQFTIWVDPQPVIRSITGINRCQGDSLHDFVFESSVQGSTFTWIHSNSAIGIPPSGAGSFPAMPLANPYTIPLQSVATVTASANSCASEPLSFLISVYPIPLVQTPQSQALCNLTQTMPVQFQGEHQIIGYTWTNHLPAIGLPATGSDSIPSFLAVNTDTSDLVAQIQVQAVNPGCSGPASTFDITVYPSPLLEATADSAICRGNAIQLGTTRGLNLNWGPSAGLSCTQCARPIASPEYDQQYRVTGYSDRGCVGTDSVQIRVYQPFTMQVTGSDSICPGQSAHLLAAGADSYQWIPADGLDNPVASSPIASPDQTTRYQVIGRDAHACFSDTGYVTVVAAPAITVALGPDIQAATGTEITLQPQTEPAQAVSWQWQTLAQLSCTDCPSPVLTVGQPAEIILTVKNTLGCSFSDSLRVLSFCKSAQVYVPNAFTPDGDGLNDVLMIRGTGIRIKTFKIYNRWGNLVFESKQGMPNQTSYGWDGRYKGALLPADVFIYVAEVVCDNGVTQILKGNAAIIR